MTAALLTRNELDKRLAPLEALSDLEGPTEAWRFAVTDDGMVARVADQELSVTALGFEQALAKVPGLGKAAVTQWPMEMLVDTVNWFYEHGEGQTRALAYDGKLVSFTKSTAPLYRTSQVLELMEQGITAAGGSAKDLQFANVRAEMDRVTFGLVVPTKTHEPKVGDVVQAGIWLHHSPTSRRAGEIAPYVNRLVCTNGMISARSLQKWGWRPGVPGDDGFERWVTAATEMAFEAMQAEFDGLTALTQQALNGHASTVVEDLFERHRVPAALRESVLEALIDESDGTMYGIAQAFNRAANEVDDIAHMRHLLMVTGDVVAEVDRCDSCFRAL